MEEINIEGVSHLVGLNRYPISRVKFGAACGLRLFLCLEGAIRRRKVRGAYRGPSTPRDHSQANDRAALRMTDIRINKQKDFQEINDQKIMNGKIMNRKLIPAMSAILEELTGVAEEDDGPARRMTSKRIGELSEAALALKARTLGFMVAKPWGDSELYDFILGWGKLLWRCS